MEPPIDAGPEPQSPHRKPSFRFAMLALAALGALAAFTLDGVVRLVTLIFLGGLVLKTLIARKAGW